MKELGNGFDGTLSKAIESSKLASGKPKWLQDYMIITKDSSEFMYVRDDLSVQKIRPRNRCFASVTEANEQLNETEDTYAGQTVMVKDENGKYAPWIVQQSEATGLFSIEPFYVEPTNFVWQEF